MHYGWTARREATVSNCRNVIESAGQISER